VGGPATTEEELTAPRSRPSSPPPRFATGDVIAQTYEVRGLLGAGGMGEVFDAEDHVLNRRVAIKTSRAEVDPEYLLREGRALAAIRHPGVVAVHASGLDHGVPFLVLERVQGVGLDKVIAERRSLGQTFTVPEVLDLLVAVADTLRVVHGAGLTHRDVKPSNVMLAAAGRVVLMDFGLVMLHAERADNDDIAGSLTYMAPEALAGRVAPGLGYMVDIYALGVIAFELLSGAPPFQAAGSLDMHRAKTVLPVPAVAPDRADLPAPLRELVGQMIEPDANERPPGAEAVLWQLRSMRSRSSRVSVLVVDDDPDLCGAIASFVRVELPDADIEVTGDGARAVHAVRRRTPDLIFLDLDLPGMNGIEVCMVLRGMSLGEDCTVLCTSGRATHRDVKLIEELGFQFAPKGPGLVDQLVREMKRLRRAAGIDRPSGQLDR
jgi:serine/threonine-protein kinase